MHVVFRESHGLEETDTPTDLGQSPADLVVLSFSDSDLGAFAEGWHRRSDGLPGLRLANLTALRHPLSVDTYVEQTLTGARGILIRLIGGVPYWEYGLQQVLALAQEKGIALAVLPADGRPDPRLDAYSTLPVSTLRRLAELCDNGGSIAAQAALQQLALAAGLYAAPVRGAKVLPMVGAWTPEYGACCPLADLPVAQTRILIVFYRSYVVAADLAPIEALMRAFQAQGHHVRALFTPSLKAPEAAGWLRRQVQAYGPHAIVNATAFSGKGDDGTSPLDAGNVPVFQAALATSTREAWDGSERGLSPADLAMHIVLPEVDGRLTGGTVSFKEPGVRDPDLEFSRFAHRAEPDLTAALVARVQGWLDLAAKPAASRHSAIILSTYPGKDWQMGHAVGLDAPASARAILSDLRDAGYTLDETPDALEDRLLARDMRLSLADYKTLVARLPAPLRDDLYLAWGRPEDDADVVDGEFRFAALRLGNAIVALQPERGTPKTRDDDYHDLSRVPRHAYVAFYLWLQTEADALVHIGAHGTLEWLPGKAVALSPACWPEALTGTLPVIYPFIVNDPGEAAQAKRRIGAVTLGHVPPPMQASAAPDRLSTLESLLDEFSTADGLDPRRRDRLQADIRAEAQALGVEDDLGLDRATSTAEAITRIDRFVCDIKESMFGDGLHIWGRPDTDAEPMQYSARAERQSLLEALDGRRIAAGPSGSPYRGRDDVLPTGRNLFTTDPRSVPTRAAYAQGVKLAEELIRRHLQEEGDWPRGLIVDLWGSATMRTAGEEFAMALHLLGVRPVWDKGSERVSGLEVLPIAELDRPRIDVTLRVSGLFRDVFPTLSGLFSQAVRALEQRDEAHDWNPYAGHASGARVYGPAPGNFGLGMGTAPETYTAEARTQAGEAWLSASAWALDGDEATRDDAGIRARVENADSFVHLQDLPESDLLLAADYATHEAGFAAAQSVTGGHAALYHLDNTDPKRPRARTLPEEIARVVHARATNPGWIAGMKRHGFRGAAEIAATLDHMAAFANLAQVVGPHLFDAYHDATLGDPDTDAFLREANPEAYAAMQARFRALLDAGLWQTRRNAILAGLEDSA
ncbi:cobaltochelatase subunit CobN [Roseovarius atlanticus]|uniref:cobaltochelatase subunit CobN n=1 Tax=Roseovarius atlanticus TaxID=1641875 RepID=UPI001C989290|nr:cobaltochelatase subunit CobN [Roseovarius atlanticus]MBY5989926.1 cobaltochelatase subunit CobN [Roseovarius atlanticus]MBY6126471.1 cobaltochelatase subunit CobN [Roseovarius atlanticus]MBY6150965.1 cobaltochelatase subunit CobN [Roseovarius atlanticus]